MAVYQLPGVRRQVDQGPPSQDTFPVPGISQPVQAYYQRQDEVRYRVTPAPQLEQPAPPTTDVFLIPPDLTSYQPVRLQVPTTLPFDGPSLQDSYIFPVNQPELQAYARREMLRYIVGATPWTDTIVAPAAQTYEFLLGQPYHTRFDINRILTGPKPQVDYGLVSTEYWPSPPPPDFSRWFAQEVARRYGGPIPYIHQGATIQDWFIYPVNQPRKELVGFPSIQVQVYLAVSSNGPFPPPTAVVAGMLIVTDLPDQSLATDVTIYLGGFGG